MAANPELAGPTQRFQCCVLDGNGKQCPNRAQFWVGANEIDDYTHACAEHVEEVQGHGDTVRELERGFTGGSMKFRKKPVIVEAVKWDGDADLANSFLGERYGIDWKYAAAPNAGDLLIPTLEGDMRANIGDWIIRGVKGECYPCKPDIFVQTYEPVEAP